MGMNTTGMDYHLAEVEGSGTLGLRAPFQAKCRCGWVGREYETRDPAEEDACAHDVAENPIGGDG